MKYVVVVVLFLLVPCISCAHKMTQADQDLRSVYHDSAQVIKMGMYQNRARIAVHESIPTFLNDDVRLFVKNTERSRVIIDDVESEVIITGIATTYSQKPVIVIVVVWGFRTGDEITAFIDRSRRHDEMGFTTRVPSGPIIYGRRHLVDSGVRAKGMADGRIYITAPASSCTFFSEKP